MFFKKLWRSIEGLETSIEKLNERMFGDDENPNRTWWSMEKRIDELDDRPNPELIDCHTCGCVVRKEIAFRSHDRIERELVHDGYSTFIRGGRVEHDIPPLYSEIIYETWYCKLHKRDKKAYVSK